MSAPQTRIELDIATANGCQHPDCKDPQCGGTLHLAPKCHRRGVIVAYKNGSGVLEILCFECRRHVTMIKVAD